jgi:hypothetical protein
MRNPAVLPWKVEAMMHTKKIRAFVLSILQLLLLFSLSCNVAIYDELFEPEKVPEDIFITSVTPNSGMEPDLVFITDLIGGCFMEGATVMLCRTGFPDIVATSVTVVNDTHITCEIDLTGAVNGQWDVVVINLGGFAAILPGGFTVDWDAPTLTAIAPIIGSPGYTVWINNLSGTNFKSGATVLLTMVGQPNIVATGITVVDETRITCQYNLTGAASGHWNVIVQNSDGKTTTLVNGFTVQPALFREDWEDGVWDDTWVDDRTTGDTVIVTTFPTVPPGARSLLISDNADWTYFDCLHYEFGGGINPGYVRFYIRRSGTANLPWINIGGDNTPVNQGAIWFGWDDEWGNGIGQKNRMFVTDNINNNYVTGYEITDTTFHLIEFRNINFVTPRFDFYVDGVLVAANVQFHNPVPSFTRFYISVGWYVSFTHIDDIEIWL